MSSDEGKRSKKRALGPEKVVEKEVLAAAKEIGLDLSVIDSKAIYSKNRESYMKNYCVPEGAPDLWGNDSNGIAVFVELKAPGKLGNLSQKQRQFLVRKAEQGCFAVAVDSPQLLFDLYIDWRREGKERLLRFLQSV